MSQAWLQEMHDMRRELDDMAYRVDNLHRGLACVLNDGAALEMSNIANGLEQLARRLSNATGNKVNDDYTAMRQTANNLMLSGLAIALGYKGEQP